MNKLDRLNKLEKLLKIQEKHVLVEFKEVQNLNDMIKNHIQDLELHDSHANKNVLNKPISTGELHIAKSFSQKVVVALAELNKRLDENEKQFLIVGDKIKRVRSSIKSIQRLIDKQQVIENNKQDNYRQKEIEANINYLTLT